jgi:hypothetical protein
MLWKRIALVLVPVALIVGATLPAATGAEEVMSQQQAQEMLSTYGEEGLINMGLSAEQLKNLKIIASGGTYQSEIAGLPLTEPVQSTPLIDALTARNLLNNFGVAGLLGMGLTFEQISLIQLAAGNF